MSRTNDFNGGREHLGELIRSAHDWNASSLGPPSRWPSSLHTVLRIMLASRYAMWLGWGPELTFFYNDAYREQTLGGKHPSALGRPFREVWPEAWEPLAARIEHVMATGESTWDEGLLLFLERSGYTEETYHTFSYSPAPNDDGSIGGLFCVVTEETDRVIGERRLKMLRDLASRLGLAKSVAEVGGAFAQCLEGDPREFPFSTTYLFDADGRVAERTSRSGIAASHPAVPAHIDLDRAPPGWPLRELLAGGGPRVVDLDASHSWPSTIWGKAPTQAILVPLARQGQTRPAGVFIAALNPFRPVDEGVRSFAGLLVGQLGAALANARAYEEERRRAEALADLDRQKTEFFSSVSHEFRTPLTLMLGPIEEALASASGALRGENLDTTHRNALRLLKLVNALLDFSRIEAGRVEASYEKTDLSALTGELASVFRSAIQRAGLDFVVDVPAIDAPIYVDRDMWEKIVLNLLSNALKFTFEGRIAIGLTLTAEHDAVALTVRDTGTGVPAAEVPHLFERFHRVRGARARTHEGSGIGLALVNELVKLHSGHVRVESIEGHGTLFEIRIPTGKAHLPAGAIAPERPRAPGLLGAAPYVEEALRWVPAHREGESDAPTSATVPYERETNSSERIVLADDNADMRDYVARLLRTRWRVEPVSDGQAALAAIRRAPPALLLSDVMMPGLDGFGLLRELRADPATRTLPVILLSARAGEESTSEGLQAGANDYLSKPFSARELIARVASQLAIAGIRREAEREREAQRQVIEKLFNEAPAAIAMLRGPDFVIEFANPRIVEIWQRGAASDVVGKPMLVALPELAGQGFDHLLRGVMKTGQTYFGYEAPVTLRRGGERVSLLVNFVYVPTRDAHGNIEGVSVFAFDVTRQVLARKRAELGSEVGRAFVTSEPLGVQLSRCCNALITMGAAFARIWTYDTTRDALDLRATAGSSSDVDGPSAHAQVGALQIGRIAQSRKAHLLSDLSNDLEFAEKSWAAREGLTAFAGFPLVVGDRLVGVVALFARAPLSDELVTALATVADQIALAIDREAGERFRELFIGMLGHDLRNPLNAVLMATHLLSASATEPQKRVLVRLENSARRMERMITQVLDFTRARSGGGIPLVQKPSDLRAICEQVVEELVTGHPERAIELGAATSAVALWDADRMAQVFSNLVGNALTFGRKGAPVRVQLDVVGDEVLFSVHNEGPPIPSELMPKLFDPFRRARQAKAAATQGLGLGLFITQQIVAAHGGSIAVQSDEASGTLFTVTLPLQAVQVLPA